MAVRDVWLVDERPYSATWVDERPRSTVWPFIHPPHVAKQVTDIHEFLAKRYATEYHHNDVILGFSYSIATRRSMRKVVR
jgi:hypothetical protein